MMNLAVDLEAVRTTVASVAHDIDAKNWAALQALYAAEVETDYTSLFGGAPTKQANQTLISGWRTVLERVATQHLLGPIVVRVEGERATARCHVRAMHHASGAASGEAWEVFGHYVFELARDRDEPGIWRITRMKLETLLQTGNNKLLQEA